MRYFFLFIVYCFLLFSHCIHILPPDSITRKNSKIQDEQKQQLCSRKGDKACENNNKCKNACDKVFSNRRDRSRCLKLPEELVFDFKDLLEGVEDGNTDFMETSILECLLDLDEEGFAETVQKQVSRSEAKTILNFIVEQEDIAEVFETEDDEFNIFKQLFMKAVGSYSLSDILTKEIDNERSFFYLAAEENSYAYIWLDNFVEQQCGKADENCPGGDPIGAYCKALMTLNNNNLGDFLNDAVLFEEEYEDDVDEADFLYQVTESDSEGFRGFCTQIVGVS